MDEKAAVKIIKNEMACVKMADKCDRDCANCPLIMDSGEILGAYELAIDALRRRKRMACLVADVMQVLCGVFFVIGLLMLSAVGEDSEMFVIFGLISFGISVIIGNLGVRNE